jgi:hypothetical protein
LIDVKENIVDFAHFPMLHCAPLMGFSAPPRLLERRTDGHRLHLDIETEARVLGAVAVYAPPSRVPGLQRLMRHFFRWRVGREVGCDDRRCLRRQRARRRKSVGETPNVRRKADAKCAESS